MFNFNFESYKARYLLHFLLQLDFPFNLAWYLQLPPKILTKSSTHSTAIHSFQMKCEIPAIISSDRKDLPQIEWEYPRPKIRKASTSSATPTREYYIGYVLGISVISIRYSRIPVRGNLNEGQVLVKRERREWRVCEVSCLILEEGSIGCVGSGRLWW